MSSTASTHSPTLTIIGAGNLGKTLAHLWHRQGIFAIRDVYSRDLQHAQAAAVFIGAGQAANVLTDLRMADAYLLSVPDDSIASVCRQLAAAGLLRPGCLVFHCSGALTAAALQAARGCQAEVASAHPIRSFADPASLVDDFAGTWCGVEGDCAALARLGPAFEGIGATLVPVDSQFKTLYHAAAVFASNYLVTLFDIGLQAYEQAGIPRATGQRILAPLVAKTLENITRVGPEAALSGPIARGDLEVVKQQQQALAAWHPAHGALYRQLGQATQALAQRARAAAADARKAAQEATPETAPDGPENMPPPDMPRD